MSIVRHRTLVNQGDFRENLHQSEFWWFPWEVRIKVINKKKRSSFLAFHDNLVIIIERSNLDELVCPDVEKAEKVSAKEVLSVIAKSCVITFKESLSQLSAVLLAVVGLSASPDWFTKKRAGSLRSSLRTWFVMLLLIQNMPKGRRSQPWMLCMR